MIKVKNEKEMVKNENKLHHKQIQQISSGSTKP